MHRIILRLVEEITIHLVSSSHPLLYVNTQFHISNKQFHIFFQILRCSKMNQDEEQQNGNALRFPQFKRLLDVHFGVSVATPIKDVSSKGGAALRRQRGRFIGKDQLSKRPRHAN